jgi:hypothetical protein
VLLTNRDAKTDLFYAPEHTGSNIRTPRVVAEVLRELFFAAVRSREARVNRYVRHGNPQAECLHYVMDSGVLAASYFWVSPVIPDTDEVGRLPVRSVRITYSSCSGAEINMRCERTAFRANLRSTFMRDFVT